MKIGTLIDGEAPVDDVIEEVKKLAQLGFESAWAPQIFGHDSLTLLALVGREVPEIDLGTAVVPVYPRHPQVLAQQALTVQQAVGGRLTLGIGLSHQIVVESLWGYQFDRPADFMREYLTALVPLLGGEAVSFEGAMVKAVTTGPLQVRDTPPPPVLVAALGPVMLRIAGQMAAGTVTWMTGMQTVEKHIAPTIRSSAEASGRPSPEVVVNLPVAVTAHPGETKERIDRAFAIYPNLPSYRAMLEREGASKPSDIALVGSEDDVTESLHRLEEAGATEFVASVVAEPNDREQTAAFVASLSSTF